MNGNGAHPCAVAVGGPGAGPEIFPFAEVPSCLDAAFELARAGRLRIWDSALAASQTAGRGQLRRQWHSPPGNIYAALRLPVTPPFDGSSAAPAVGLLAAEALGALGWHVRIKWPNDLVLHMAGVPRKVAGILLEERGGVLLAGIGVNVRPSAGCGAGRRLSCRERQRAGPGGGRGLGVPCKAYGFGIYWRARFRRLMARARGVAPSLAGGDGGGRGGPHGGERTVGRTLAVGRPAP